MAEEEQQSSEELWGNTPEYGEEPAKAEPVPEEPEPEEEEEGEEDEIEEADVGEYLEEDSEDIPPEEDWEDRYRNLESSHSRRGNEVHTLKEERDNLRLEKLEMAQQLQEYEAGKAKLKEIEEKEAKAPDPYDDEQ